eukprot:scaffold9369_cov182-Amphora_coffeaeformis.AAC.10
MVVLQFPHHVRLTCAHNIIEDSSDIVTSGFFGHTKRPKPRRYGAARHAVTPKNPVVRLSTKEIYS